MERLLESPMIRNLQEMEPELLHREELILIQEKKNQQGRENLKKEKRRDKNKQKHVPINPK